MTWVGPSDGRGVGPPAPRPCVADEDVHLHGVAPEGRRGEYVDSVVPPSQGVPPGEPYTLPPNFEPAPPPYQKRPSPRYHSPSLIAEPDPITDGVLCHRSPQQKMADRWWSPVDPSRQEPVRSFVPYIPQQTESTGGSSLKE